ncbi:hemolysin family protein [Ramlibacter rhizophilus]|uniref:HlyC/CorC family transporter n=1 Tax=Ramlibacter rhizophilus TaxID=1781167 RepID=A0A4Z0BSE3_9BURK|nr:hemolysin family protein [Ramlibacter rhizophilus]TFZ01350.1 HlyC/CorC family transporter [Ramlibacter rhizophilus]
MEVVFIAFLTLLNGAFAMCEMALASARRGRLAAMAEDGDRGAQTALSMMDEPTQFLSTVQVGITSIGLLNGIVGEAAFSGGLSAWMVTVGLSDAVASVLATVVVVAVITYVTIVFGELVPKRIAQMYPESIARWMARPMGGLARAASPFVRLLSATTRGVLKLLGVALDRPAITEEELAHSLAEGVDAGLIEQHERQMVQNVFHLDERPLTSMMIPRSDIEWLDASLTVAECLARAGREDGHSWYPVCRGSLDNVLGLVSVSRLLSLGADQHAGAVEAHVVPAAFLPETLSGLELLEQFRAQAARIVLVVDEYGVVQGLMTPRDLLEAITGELQPEQQTEAWATRREDGSWLLDGTMPVSELKARLAIRELPEEDRGRYNTLAGLLMAESGHLPGVGERIECAGWSFEVVDLDGKRIDKVLAVFTPA